MPKKDPRVDAYIKKSQDFAKPILTHLREVIHKACPDVEETIKWSFPNFVYKNAVMCNMAGFKAHAVFGFWKSSLLKDPHKVLKTDGAMGSFDKLTNLKDLPSDKILIEYIHEAMKLNEQGMKVERKKPPVDKKIVIPGYLKKALELDKKAAKQFESFSYSKKKEYVEWLEEAKTEETREKRLLTAIDWISEGKGRNWKYER